jgi:hypothetical protein
LNPAQNPGDPEGESITGRRDAAFLISLFAPALTGFHLLLTSTTYLFYPVWIYDSKRMLEFALLLVLFLAPALSRPVREEFGALLSIVPGWLGAVLLGMVGWGTFSALYNAQSVMHALNSLSEVALLSALALGVFVLAACRRIAGRWFDRIALSMLALTGLAVGVQELLGVLAAHAAGLEFNFRISLLYFSWPRFYNQVQSWAVPALAALPLLFIRHRLAYVLCFITLGLQWYIILVTGARGSFVSIGAASLFALIFLPPVRARLFRWQLASLAFGLVIFAAVLFSFEAKTPAGITRPAEAPQTSSVAAEPAERSGGARPAGEQSSFFQQSVGKSLTGSSGRFWMWSETIKDTRDNPLLGIGPMNYVCTGSKRIGHPHNFALQLSAEWGLPVALAAFFIFSTLLWRIASSIRDGAFGDDRTNVIAGLLFTGVLAAALHSCLSGVMVMPASQVAGLLVCGMLLGLYPSTANQRAVAALRWLCIPGLVLAAGLLLLGTHEVQTMEQRAKQLSAGASLWPRMWQDSKVCALYNL